MSKTNLVPALRQFVSPLEIQAIPNYLMSIIIGGREDTGEEEKILGVLG